MKNSRFYSIAFFVSLASLLLFASCTISNKEGKDGKDNVDIKTPFGSLKVDENVDARDTGLPLYAGAKPVPKENDDTHGANVNISSNLFGVKVVAMEFTSPDSPDKIRAFYDNALKTYGKVLECQGAYNVSVQKGDRKGDDPVTCDNTGHDAKGVELKVGTQNHQHIVGLKPDGAGTRFALIYVNLRGEEKGS